MIGHVTTDHQLGHFRLLDVQIRLGLQHLAHLQAVLLLVALRARRPHGRPARSIQQAKLDSDRVGHLAHDAAQRVDFANEVPLGDATHGGIARHLRDEIDVEGEQRGLQPHAGSGHRSLASGMTGADDNDVEDLSELNRRQRDFPHQHRQNDG